MKYLFFAMMAFMTTLATNAHARKGDSCWYYWGNPKPIFCYRYQPDPPPPIPSDAQLREWIPDTPNCSRLGTDNCLAQICNDHPQAYVRMSRTLLGRGGGRGFMNQYCRYCSSDPQCHLKKGERVYSPDSLPKN